MSSYADAGVHLDDARHITGLLPEIVRRARGRGVLADVGAFGGMFALADASSVSDPVLVASADGIGTKVQIAATLRRLAGLGADIVNHCVNDIAVQGATPLFFLDYLAMHRTEPDVVAVLVQSVAEACRIAGCSLLGGETAEMPDVYHPGGLDIAGFIVGVMDRSAINASGTPAVDDLLIGLPSTGLHTNGFSLARKVLPPETWTRQDETIGGEIGDALLAPHRSYLNEIQTLRAVGARGFAHITGGGFPDNVARVLSGDITAIIDTDSWNPLPIFTLIADTGNIPREEMYQVFNMGIGLVAALPPALLQAARLAVPEARVIGKITARNEGGVVRLTGAGFDDGSPAGLEATR